MRVWMSIRPDAGRVGHGRTRARSRTLTASLVALLAAASGAGAQGPPAALVVTAPVVSESVKEEMEFIGTVQPVLDSLVASEVEGRVAERLVENGERVRKGEDLVRLDPTRLKTDLVRAEADRGETEARLVLARSQEQRAQELLESDVVASDLYDERVAERKALEGRLSSIEARIEAIRYDLSMATIRAPFDGIITEIHAEVGEWLARGAAVVRLADLGTVEILFEIPERYYPQLKQGSAAPVRLDALPDLVLDAKIFSIVPQASTEARTFPVLLRAANPRRAAGAGMLARVKLAVSTGREALLVPKDAIVRQADQTVIFVVNGDDTVKSVGVRTRRADGTRVEVTGDIAAGDIVVVKGNERLAPGQKVRRDAGAPAVAPVNR